MHKFFCFRGRCAEIYLFALRNCLLLFSVVGVVMHRAACPRVVRAVAIHFETLNARAFELFAALVGRGVGRRVRLGLGRGDCRCREVHGVCFFARHVFSSFRDFLPCETENKVGTKRVGAEALGSKIQGT